MPIKGKISVSIGDVVKLYTKPTVARLEEKMEKDLQDYSKSMLDKRLEGKTCEAHVGRWWDTAIRGYSSAPRRCRYQATREIDGLSVCQRHFVTISKKIRDREFIKSLIESAMSEGRDLLPIELDRLIRVIEENFKRR